MKNIFAVLVVLASLSASAQTSTPAKENKPATPEYFIDSVKVDLGSVYLKYIDPQEIASIYVSKEAAHPTGAIFITLKNHDIITRLQSDRLVSLGEICKDRIPAAEKNRKMIFVLDEVLLTDTSKVRIPSMFIKKVTIVKASEMPYFKTTLPNVLLMRISTKPEQVYIR